MVNRVQEEPLNWDLQIKIWNAITSVEMTFLNKIHIKVCLEALESLRVHTKYYDRLWNE